MDLLAVKPFRGAPVAAGVVVLAVLVAASDAGLALQIPALVLVAALALATPVPAAGPLPWHATLYVGTWVLALLVVREVLDDVQYEALALAVVAGVLLFVKRAASTTLLCAASLLAAGTLGDEPPDRWALLGFAVLCTLGAVTRRDRLPDHARALAGVGGVAVLLIALPPHHLFTGDLADRLDSTWWLLMLLAAGFGQVAYGLVDDARVSVALGAAALALFADRADAAGWLILLGVAAAALLLTGLRPTTPLPPPPGYDAEPAPLPITLRPVDRE